MSINIVTVVLNDPKGLAMTLDSLAGQTDTFQLTIVDGASNDSTLHVAHEGAASLGGRVFSREDLGPYHAMNFALTTLHPEDLVWFVNAGDTLTDAKAIADVAEWSSARDFSWGFGPVRVVEKDGRFRKVPFQAPYSRVNVALGRTPICHQTVVARVSCLQAVGGFDTAYHLAADYKQLLRLSGCWSPTVWPRPVAQYRAGGMSDRRITETMRQQRAIRRQEVDLSPQDWALANLIDSARGTRLMLGRFLDWGVDRGFVPFDWRARAARGRP